MLMSTMGLRSEKDSAGDAQQKLKTTNQINNPLISVVFFNKLLWISF
jgi:hypothetical protein